jgi:hypothetical protein
MNPLDRILRGAVAGTLGTLAMDTLLYRRYRRGGGDADFPGWESSEGLKSWDGAPAPALVAKRFLEAGLHREIPPRYARSLNNVMHWGFGIANGAVYGIVAASRRKPSVLYGPPFGAAVWGNGYVVLPLLGVYEPIWKYDLETLWQDLSAHLVFGTTTAAAFSLLAHGEVDQ